MIKTAPAVSHSGFISIITLPPVSMPRVAAASFVGGLLEWYDFYIFAIATALVFGNVFFPPGDPLINTMAAFGAFASGFLARPLGGVIFGHMRRSHWPQGLPAGNSADHRRMYFPDRVAPRL